MKQCFTINLCDFDISLYQAGWEEFIVTYGDQMSLDLTYDQTTKKLGECIMHALACEGKLDWEE